jgi:hypothetical protein
MVRTIPKALVFGPPREQGLGISNLYITQGIAHVERLIQYGADEGHITGQLVRASLERARVEVGMPGFLLRMSIADSGCLVTNGLVAHMWKFLSEIT